MTGLSGSTWSAIQCHNIYKTFCGPPFNVTTAITHFVVLSSISVSFEVEPQLEYVVLELTSEAMLVRVLPFTIDYLKCNILKMNNTIS